MTRQIVEPHSENDITCCHIFALHSRPETSFSWYSNPLRSMKHIVMPCLKKVCIWLVVIVVIGVAVYIAVDVAKKALEANASSSSSFGRVVGHNK